MGRLQHPPHMPASGEWYLNRPPGMLSYTLARAQQQQPGARRPADRRVPLRQLVVARVRLLQLRLHPVRGRPRALEPETMSPVCGAWINSPSPMSMPTWPECCAVPSAPGMNSRSPGWTSMMPPTAVPSEICSLVARGIVVPTVRGRSARVRSSRSGVRSDHHGGRCSRRRPQRPQDRSHDRRWGAGRQCPVSGSSTESPPACPSPSSPSQPNPTVSPGPLVGSLQNTPARGY